MWAESKDAMNSQFAVLSRVREEHWVEFHEVLFNRKSQLDTVVKWLADHGYRISRSSVHRYKSELLRGSKARIRIWTRLPAKDLLACRDRITRYAMEFDARRIELFATFGGLLASQPKPTRTKIKSPLEGSLNGV